MPANCNTRLFFSCEVQTQPHNPTDRIHYCSLITQHSKPCFFDYHRTGNGIAQLLQWLRTRERNSCSITDRGKTIFSSQQQPDRPRTPHTLSHRLIFLLGQRRRSVKPTFTHLTPSQTYVELYSILRYIFITRLFKYAQWQLYPYLLSRTV
jgi:hypothetical protein